MTELGIARGPAPEVRSYTELIVDALVSAASGSSASTGAATSALEAAAGLWGRALASAIVKPDELAAVITPEVLHLLGRQLCIRGEQVLLVSADQGRLMLSPVGYVSISVGNYNPRSWRYTCNLPGPGMDTTITVPREAVAHVRYAVDPLRPWSGRSPLQVASDGGKLAGLLEQGLRYELNSAYGYILPLPEGRSLSDTEKTTLSSLKGKLAFPKSLAGGLGDKAARPDQDYVTARVGPRIPNAHVELWEGARGAVAAACGIAPSLVLGGDSTAAREGYRRFVHSTMRPVARLVEAELSAALEQPVSLTFDDLHATDVSGKARAYHMLRGAGMDDADARRGAGLEDDDDAID